MRLAGKDMNKAGAWRLWLAVVAVVLLLFPLVRHGSEAGSSGSLPPAWDAAAGGRAAGAHALPPAGGGAAGGDPGKDRAGDDAVPAEMRQQLGDIADAYARNARYPSYATPLSANDWAQLNPGAFVPRSAPLKALPGVSATLVLERYLIDRRSDLPVRVVLSSTSGTTATAAVSAVRVLLRQQGQSSAAVTLAAAGTAAFAGVLPASALRAVAAGDIVVIAEIDTAGGERAIVTAMARSYDSAARLLGLGDARIEGADLVIPARFDVATAGLYRVQANLFTADGKVPVSHLNAEFPLAAGPAAAMMKVHAVTLRAAGEAGPYVLRDIDITRLPDQPGQPTGHGSAAAATFAVRGFPLDAYSNEPWEDPEARQRLEFLQKMAGTQARE
ncbi:MAG: hypothetical protein K0Q68_2194 [Moraxellaceae bacterium]|jgi:hypothetical protein|nr:hypothetical protein [Moraxellaceae bacterium]